MANNDRKQSSKFVAPLSGVQYVTKVKKNKNKVLQNKPASWGVKF